MSKHTKTERSAGMDQVRALAHPKRLRLLELFAREPMTTKQAADELREAPTRMYHHVAALERAGLITLKETRQNRGTTEKYYEAARSKVVPSRTALAAAAPADHAAMGMVVFDQARNELVKALAAGAAGTDEPLVALRMVCRLSPKAARGLSGELTAVLRKLREGAQKKPASRKRLRKYSLTIALVPVDDGER